MPEEKYWKGFEKVIDRSNIMFDILGESRAIKNDEEISVINYATKITCEAHILVMREIKINMREL